MVRSLRILFCLLISTVLVGTPFSALAQISGVGSLSIKLIVPQFSDEVLEAWKKDLFESDEVWIFADRNPEHFFEYMKKNGLEDSLYEQLVRLVKTELSADGFNKILSFYNLTDAESFVFVPESVKKQMSPKILRAAYTYLQSTGFAPPSRSFANLFDAMAYFSKYGLKDQDIDFVLDRIYHIRGKFYFFYTPDIWPVLTDNLKMHLIYSYLQEDSATNQGYEVKLKFNVNDDLKAIAARYAGERDPQELENRLRKLLEKSTTGSVTISLHKLMHPFIRKTAYTHAICSGPNCFNSALNVNEGEFYDQTHTGGDDRTLLDRIYKKYRFVRPDEKMQAGDLLLYRNSDGHLYHAATYVVDDLVYTKNGLSKFHPYIFQSRSQNQAIYFPDGKFQLMVFRIPKSGESVVSPLGYLGFQKREILYIDKINPIPLIPGLSPKPPPAASGAANKCVHTHAASSM